MKNKAKLKHQELSNLQVEKSSLHAEQVGF